jgi:plasmid maintenance system antidote protein VapI
MILVLDRERLDALISENTLITSEMAIAERKPYESCSTRNPI